MEAHRRPALGADVGQEEHHGAGASTLARDPRAVAHGGESTIAEIVDDCRAAMVGGYGDGGGHWGVANFELNAAML